MADLKIQGWWRCRSALYRRAVGSVFIPEKLCRRRHLCGSGLRNSMRMGRIVGPWPDAGSPTVCRPAGADAGVAQQFLHGAGRPAALQHMVGKRMAQHGCGCTGAMPARPAARGRAPRCQTDCAVRRIARCAPRTSLAAIGIAHRIRQSQQPRRTRCQPGLTAAGPGSSMGTVRQ